MYYEEIKIGDTIAIGDIPVIKEDMIAFAEKFNPVRIHTDEKYAKTTRAGQVTSSGLYTFLLFWNKYVTNDFGGEQILAGTSMNMEFCAPVFAGDILHGRATVVEKNERNDYNGIFRICIEIYNQDDRLVLKNYTDTVVKRKVF